MSLKTIRAEIKRYSDQIHSDTIDRPKLILIDVVDASENAPDDGLLPIAGYTGNICWGGKAHFVCFEGTNPEPMLEALTAYIAKARPADKSKGIPVLIAAQAIPGDALLIPQAPEGVTPENHFEQIRSSIGL